MSLAGPAARGQIRRPMRRWILLAAIVVGLSPLASRSARAQGASDDGTGGLVGLTLPVGARAVGQGRAIASARGELQGIPYNPATLSGLERGALTYSRFEAADLADLNSNYVAGAIVTTWGTIGAQLIYQDYGEILLTDDSPEPIGRTDLSEWAVGLTYANVWREKLAYGASAKWYRSDLGVAEGSGPAFDLGVIYAPRPDVPLELALSVRNVGPDLEFKDAGLTLPPGGDSEGNRKERLPSRVRVGLGVHPDRVLGLPPGYAVRLLFDIESDLRELSTSSQHAGVSLTISDVVIVRGGLVLADNPFVEEGDDDRQFGGAFGIGFRYGGFEADVAREVSVSELGDETHFGVGWRF
jgi:hypothetical protein